MVCLSPMQGYPSKSLTKAGKRKLVYNRDHAIPAAIPVTHSCGQCTGCRLKRSANWAMRIMHECDSWQVIDGHRGNSFITLTYRTDVLPKFGSLVKKHFQDFMKRLRKEIGGKIRYYYAGEYGSKFSRPHFHAILFNVSFPDKYLHSENNGHPIYRSPTLEKVWKYGYSSIGSVTFESAGYVARYIMKKTLGKDAPLRYKPIIDMDTGICADLVPEYTNMSLKPGIGAEWIKFYYSDVYPDDFVLKKSKGKFIPVSPPKYYDNIYEVLDPDAFALVKEKRKRRALELVSDNTFSRLRVKEKLLESKVVLLKRNLPEFDNVI